MNIGLEPTRDERPGWREFVSLAFLGLTALALAVILGILVVTILVAIY